MSVGLHGSESVVVVVEQERLDAVGFLLARKEVCVCVESRRVCVVYAMGTFVCLFVCV